MIKVNDRFEYLKEVAKLLPPHPSCVEIGVLNGDFAQMIMDLLSPARMVLIDPFRTSGPNYLQGTTRTAYSNNRNHHKVLDRFSIEISVGRIIVDRSYSYEAVSRCPDNSIYFIYHDASHLYPDIKRDLIEWLPKLKPNGLMCGHDYIVHEDFGVIQAVDEFIKENGFEIIIFNENGGDYALRRKQP